MYLCRLLVQLRSHSTFNNAYHEKLNLSLHNISWQNGWGRTKVRWFVCLDIGGSSRYFLCVSVFVCVCHQGSFYKVFFMRVCSSINVTWEALCVSPERFFFFFVSWKFKHHMYVCGYTVKGWGGGRGRAWGVDTVLMMHFLLHLFSGSAL